jgi:hypothetical protein
MIDDRWRNVANMLIAVVALTAIAGFMWIVWVNRFDPVLTELVLKNFAAIIGLPFAFIGSFVVVALFRQSEGIVEFKALGVSLKGAAGQIVLWVICFLAITFAIASLWIK